MIVHLHKKQQELKRQQLIDFFLQKQRIDFVI
jgi:hypothetical protein